MAAREINICKHHVRGVPLYSACDIEGHLDADGNFYLIDLARTFPPEHPDRADHLKVFERGSVVLIRRSALSGQFLSSEIVEGTIVEAYRPKDVLGADRFESFDVSTTYGTVRIHNFEDMLPSKKCIFWKFLRPEFTKHRGSLLISSMYANANNEHLGPTEVDMSSPPPVNPPLKKAISSTNSILSSGFNNESDCSSDGHTYNTFFQTSDSVSYQDGCLVKMPISADVNEVAQDRIIHEPQVYGPPMAALEATPVALSSDALSEFSRDDEERQYHNKNVELATDLLVKHLIPAMVRKNHSQVGFHHVICCLYLLKGT